MISVTMGISVVATFVQIILWKPALLEPGGLRYAQLRYMGIIALWIFVPAFMILGLLVLNTFLNNATGFYFVLDRGNQGVSRGRIALLPPSHDSHNALN